MRMRIGDAMAAKRRWSDLSKRTRRLIVTTAIVEGVLKVAALVDLKRRPADQIRGRKRWWAVLIILVNSVGLVPVSYFVLGRRRPSGHD